MRLLSTINKLRLVMVIAAVATIMSFAGFAHAQSMPGKGVTVQPAVATWGSAVPVSWVYIELLSDLGYNVKDAVSLSNPVAYLAISQGDVSYWPNGWFPLHDPQLPDNFDRAATIFEPHCSGCGIQGYLVDAASVKKFGIKSIEDFQREEVRKAFDHNGNGSADLYGCPPGWGCHEGINAMLEKFDIDYVEHIDAGYSANFAEALSHIQSGEPALYYTWGPSAWLNRLPPGKDVMWINAPGIVNSDNERASGISGAVSDPIQMGFVAADIAVAANNGFLENNPAARELFRQVRLPLGAVNQMSATMSEQELEDDEVQRLARDWINNNRSTVNKWLKAARNAAN